MEYSFDLICVGVALVDSIIRGFDPNPVSASGYRAESGSLNVGGEAVNQSIAAAKLGLKTGIVTSLGADGAGDLVVGALARRGVDTSQILRSAEHPTPITTMFVHPDGTRKSITNTAHRYNFHPEQETDRFTPAKGLMLGSLFRAPFDDPEIIASVLFSAKAAGQIVFTDTKLPNFRRLTLEDLRDCLHCVDYITPNEDEARYYSGKDTPEDMADVFLSYGIKNVVIKLGGEGCYFKNGETSFRLPACRIHAVDATGAGDNFAAGLASQILGGAAIEDALLFANACGAICAGAVGAGTALKDRDQVLEFLAKQSI